MYFSKVQENDTVFGLVFGLGTVTSVWCGSHYTFEVTYKNGFTVPYTEEGVPAWSGKLEFQTVFYKTDIDLMDLDYDFSPADKVLSVKKIIKLRDKKRLEVKCPSGLWQTIDKCPSYITEDYLEAGKLHLFRKLIKN